MRKAITIISAIVVVLCFLIIRDYNNYFYGRSLINYHILPYGLTPEYNKDYIIENGKRVPTGNFYFITDSSESIGPGRSIPMASYNPEFIIDSIKCYYYNKDSIFVFCVDEKNKPHWIIPFIDEGWVVFDEIKNIQMKSLSTYKRISIK